MGRTNPTYRDALRALRDRWDDFRRALRRRDRSRFDRLFDYAREHADAAGLLNHRNPLLPALLSIDLEQETRLDELERRIDDLEATLDAADGPETGGGTTGDRAAPEPADCPGTPPGSSDNNDPVEDGHDPGENDHDLGENDHDLGENDHDLGETDPDLGETDPDESGSGP